MIEKTVIFILGALVGSFFNVCVYRLPRGISIVRPRSFCTNCKKMIHWHDNIPFLSYILLKGKCRNCGAKYSFKYFIVEFLTGLGFLFLYAKFGLSLNFLMYAALVSGLIVATFVDIELREIPDEISLGGVGIGVLFNIFKSLNPGIQSNILPVVDSLIGVVVGGGIIYLTGLFGNLLFFKLLRKKTIDGETETMGGGDVKFLAMIGAFLGWKLAIMVFFIAPFIGSVAGFYELLHKGKHTIPYGPALALATIICIFWSDKIVFWLFGMNL